MFPHFTKVQLQRWIDENRDDWGQRRHIWENSDFTCMVTIGPNARKDFHVNPGDEFFQQLEGDLNLYYMTPEGKQELAVVGPGEVFLLPSGVPHSPRRGPGSWTLVVERKAHPGEVHYSQWYCDKCGHKLHETSRAYGEVSEPPERKVELLRADEKLRTCGDCGCVSDF